VIAEKEIARPAVIIGAAGAPHLVFHRLFVIEGTDCRRSEREELLRVPQVGVAYRRIAGDKGLNGFSP
jgi:hypothetical protein